LYVSVCLYGHETCLTRYVQETQTLVSPSLIYNHASYGCGRGGSHKGTSSRAGATASGRGRGGGKFASF